MSHHIKIALVDDEQLILEGVKMLLSKEKNFSVTMMANNGNLFLENLEKCPTEDFPDIALVDVQMQPYERFRIGGDSQRQIPRS